MIITRLSGGLGNQLFQYALGRRLALQHKVPLKLDLSGYTATYFRSYRLQHWSIVAEPAAPREIARLQGGRGPIGQVYRWYQARQPFTDRRWVAERSLRFEPALALLGPHVYLQGYWQSECYFTPIANQLRQELTVMTPPSAANRALAEEIGAVSSVSLHVRRSDYLQVENRHHGLAGVDYYQRAMAYLAERVAGARFYLFSDDPAWAREHIGFGHPCQVVELNDSATEYEDLRLMRGCRHHIIANSSFSWWAAWLSEGPSTIVIAPLRWFATPERDSRDIVPERWVRA